MARSTFSLVVSVVVGVWSFGGCPAYLLADDKPTVKVAKHIAEGSTVTPKQMEDWFKKAKDNWAPWINLEQVGTVDNTADTSTGRVAGAVNVYGTSLTATPPGNPGSCHDQDHIEMGPGAALTTLKHEFVHWFGAYPDNATTEHGTPTGTYPGYDNFTGSDTNGDGVDNATDRDNIAYPGTARTGESIDPDQGKRAAEGAKKWLKTQEAIKTGRGKDSPAVAYNELPQYDLTFTQFYSWGPAPTQINLKGLVLQMSSMTKIGFWIDSDQNPTTGEHITGFDYKLTYNHDNGSIVFEENNYGSWSTLSSSGITQTLQYQNFDGPFPPVDLGVELTFSETLLARRGLNQMILVQAFSSDGILVRDIAPPMAPQIISTVPTPVMLSGQVTLQDTVINPTSLGLQMEVRPPGNPTPLLTLPISFEDASGNYFINNTSLPAGMYDMSIKQSHWLRQTLPSMNLTLESNWANFSLINGDVNGDNRIDAADLSDVLATMDLRSDDPGFNHGADLDDDNEITSTDLSIVLKNMDTMGNP
ncbi:MAG: dockerin type I repeat-containing protein [Phycisphaerae bacterium]